MALPPPAAELEDGMKCGLRGDAKGNMAVAGMRRVLAVRSVDDLHIPRTAVRPWCSPFEPEYIEVNFVTFPPRFPAICE